MQNPAIIQPGPKHAQALIQLAHTTWQATYPGIISQEQIDFMLERFYNPPLVESQLADPTQFFRALQENNKLLAYLHAYEENHALKVSKLYVLPTMQGRGFGQQLLQTVENEARNRLLPRIMLHVNRFNPAYHFYLKQGYRVIETIDIPLEKFMLNDYIMEKQLKTE
jgi:ribosomal protein S18 acetylase RimI-like enzyme